MDRYSVFSDAENGGNTYDLGTGSHVPNHNQLADHRRHQQQSIDQRTVNVNYTSMNPQAVLEQPAGSSKSSKENNVDPKKLAEQRSDLKYSRKYRQKKKIMVHQLSLKYRLKYGQKKKKMEETKYLERKMYMLMENNIKLLKKRNEYLENKCASSEKDNARLEEDLKQCKRDVCELKDRHLRQSTTITEMLNALVSFLFPLPLTG